MISLKSNRITDEGAKELLVSVLANPIIHEVKLDLNPIEDQTIVARIKHKLNENCCKALRFMIDYRENQVCLQTPDEDTGEIKPCAPKAAAMADQIRNYYHAEFQVGRAGCCERLSMVRCSGGWQE